MLGTREERRDVKVLTSSRPAPGAAERRRAHLGEVGEHNTVE